MITKNQQTYWDKIIEPKRGLFNLHLNELWEYRDLLMMFVRRDIVTIYKQTLLGPVWVFIQPVLTMLVYIFVFSNLAKIPTDGIPPALFYLAGIVMWNFFSECFYQTSDTFFQNAAIFGKVYFPRLILPVSKIVSAFVKFFIQFLLFLCFLCFYLIDNVAVQPNITLLLLPVLMLLMGGLGLGAGILFSSLTTKYRDLKFVIHFGVQLLMFMTPVIYPTSIIPEDYQSLMFWNPLAHLIEAFKYAFIGTGNYSIEGIAYSLLFTVLMLIVGIIVFNRVEKNFIDTV